MLVFRRAGWSLNSAIWLMHDQQPEQSLGTGPASCLESKFKRRDWRARCGDNVTAGRKSLTLHQDENEFR